jgi:hypothetical protein
MSSAHDAALSFLLAQQTQESVQINRQAVVTKVTVSMTPAPSKKLAKKNEPAPIREKREPMPAMAMPDRGSLGAKDFLLAMRNAGRRVNAETNATYIDQREVRNDQIQAIHAFFYQETKAGKVYVGYDPRRDFGSQDTAARALAQRELRGAPKVSQETAPSRTFGGYVAGMPDHKARTLANLQGREVAAVDAMLAHEKDAADMSRSEYERTLSAGLADAERERLTHIRADIAALL